LEILRIFPYRAPDAYESECDFIGTSYAVVLSDIFPTGHGRRVFGSPQDSNVLSGRKDDESPTKKMDGPIRPGVYTVGRGVFTGQEKG
jgi:hypothetical protein